MYLISKFLKRLRRFPDSIKKIWIILIVVMGILASVTLAEYCWSYIYDIKAHNPKNWACANTTAPSQITGQPQVSADPSLQYIIDEHYNWHCANGHIGAASHTDPDPDFPTHFNQPGYGHAFLGLHKQMISDFDLWRDSSTALGRIEIWDVNGISNPSDPNYDPMPWGIPGSGVSAADAGAIAGGTCLVGTGRSGNGVDPATYTPCPACQVLYAQFRVPPFGTLGISGTAGDFATADDLGNELDSGWHASFHSGISSATDSGGNSCNDMNPPRTSPRDPMFWRAHANLDEVQAVWQRLQSTDIVIVLDRSGSMGQAAEAGSSTTKMDAAKSAAELFADLIENGEGHTVGIVSFSSSATAPPDLGLTTADSSILGTVQTALSSITPGGSTSIGDGLLKAQTELVTNGSNDRKAILLLTDGKENTAPCLDGTGFLCLGSGSDIASNAFGDTQVCAIGYGEAASLDEIVLRDLTERQAGLYISGTGTPLQITKFFIDCFADIFDETMAVDPVGELAAGEMVSEPVKASASFASKITFVLSWEEIEDPLRLRITSPSGQEVDLSDPSIETSLGRTWQIVRIQLPYQDESGGNWTAQAVRSTEFGITQQYFINVLTAGGARLNPSAETFFPYTGDLTIKVRIPSSYRPMDEYDQVDAKVILTRPLVGTGNLLSEFGLENQQVSEDQFGDLVDARTARLLELGAELEDLIPTETETFQLYDDGTHGDRFANNHYWTVTLPDLAAVEGQYQFHYIFSFTEDGETFTREMSEANYIEVRVDPDATETTIDPMEPSDDGRNTNVVVFVPKDSLGNLLGPGRADQLEISTTGDTRIEDDIVDDGHGAYSVTVSWTDENSAPTLVLSQNGQARQKILLVENQVVPQYQLDIEDLLADHSNDDRPIGTPIEVSVQREVSTTAPNPGDLVTVTIVPDGFESYYYGLRENVGDLEYTGINTAKENPADTTFIMYLPASFTYELRVPDTAQRGDKFTIQGEFWDDLGSTNRMNIPDTVLVVGGETDEPDDGFSLPWWWYLILIIVVVVIISALTIRFRRNQSASSDQGDTI